MLCRLQAADAHGRPLPPVPQATPERGHEAGVVRIAAVDLDEQRPPLVVGGRHVVDAGDLPLGVGQAAGLDPELAQAGGHISQPRPAHRRSQGQPHDRRRHEGDQERGDRPDRGRLGQPQRPDAPEHEHPAAEALQRQRQVRQDGDDDRRCLGQPDVGEVGAPAAAEQRLGAGPRPDRQAAHCQGEGAGEHHCCSGLADDHEAAAHEGDQREGDGPQPDGVGEEAPDRLEP